MKINKSVLTTITIALSLNLLSIDKAYSVSVIENIDTKYDSNYPYNVSDSIKILERAEQAISEKPDSIRWKNVPEHLLRVYLWHRETYHDADNLKLSNTWIDLASKVKDKDVIEYAKLSKVFANLLKQNFREAEKVYNTVKFDKYNKNDLFTDMLIYTLLGEEKETKASFQGNKNYSFTYTIRNIRVEDAKKLTDKFPNSDISHYIYSLVLQKLAESGEDKNNIDYRDSIEQLEEAIKIFPNNKLYQLKKAQLSFDKVNPENNDDIFEKIYKDSYKDSYVGESIAVTYARNNNFEKAIEYINDALRQDPSRITLYKKLNSLYSYTNNYTELIDVYEKAINKYPNMLELYYDLAELYSKTKAEPNKTIDLFTKAVKENPNNDLLNLYLGDAYYSNREFDKSLENYKKSVELNPNNVDSYGKIIGLYWDLNDNENVMKFANEAIKNNKEFAMGYLWLGSSYLRQNKINDAIASIKKSINVKPDFVVAYNSLGMAYKVAKKYDEAIEQFSKALELNANYQESALNLGDTYVIKGDYNSAEKVYEGILAKEPYNEAVFFALGNMYTESKNFDKSIKSFEKAILLNPKSLDSRNNLGNVYLKQNKLDEAIEEFEKVLKIEPKYATAYYNIACAYSIKRNTNYSLRFLEEAVTLDDSLKEVARKDPDFENIKDDNRFKELVN